MRNTIFIPLVCLVLLPGCHSSQKVNTTAFAHEMANGKWGFLDEKGYEVIPHTFDQAKDFSEGLAAVRLGSKYGYIDGKGNFVIPLRFDQAFSFKNGLAKVVCDGLEGVITEDGKTVISCKYQDIEFNFRDNVIKARQGNRYGYINFSGKTLIPFDYESIGVFDENGAALVRKDGKYGFVSLSGKEILACEYTYPQEFGPRFYLISKGKLYGLIDKKDKHLVLPCQYESLNFCESLNGMYSPHIIKARQNEKFGLLDEQGIPLTECSYDLIQEFDTTGLTVMKKTGNMASSTVPVQKPFLRPMMKSLLWETAYSVSHLRANTA